MNKRIFVLNGPNLNLLGQREPEIYGTTTLAQVKQLCDARAEAQVFDIDFRQANFEGELIESVHEARASACAIIINPAGWTFTSVKLLDALKMFSGPKIEFHITNVYTREAIYHKSLISRTATAVMMGLGASGSGVAVDAAINLVESRK